MTPQSNKPIAEVEYESVDTISSNLMTPTHHWEPLPPDQVQEMLLTILIAGIRNAPPETDGSKT